MWGRNAPQMLQLVGPHWLLKPPGTLAAWAWCDLMGGQEIWILSACARDKQDL